MRFEKLKANLLISVTSDIDGVKDRFKKVFSSNNINSIFERMQTYVETQETLQSYKLIIYDFETKKKLSVNVGTNLLLNEYFNIVVENLYKDNLVINPKTSRYQIVVRNTQGQINDTKHLTFNSSKDFEEVIIMLKTLLDNYKINNPNLLYSRHQNKTSHYIIIKRAGTILRYKLPSKCFSIKIPDHSSLEIVNIIGGKNEI